MSPYRVDKAVGTRLLVLVDLVDDQEHDTHQEGQSAHHQQGHLRETGRPVMLQRETPAPAPPQKLRFVQKMAGVTICAARLTSPGGIM